MAFRGSGAAAAAAAEARIDNPAFDDHANALFLCDYCGIPKRRGDFSSENLQSNLGDCHERRQTPATGEGPWRGVLVRTDSDGRGHLVSDKFTEWKTAQGAPPQAHVIFVPRELWHQHFAGGTPVFKAPTEDGVADLSQEHIRLEVKVRTQDGVAIADHAELLTLCCSWCADRIQEQRAQGLPVMKRVDARHKESVRGYVSAEPRHS
eukprot:TRINITY_DN2674_c0_g1_i3.p1 TRINITY_DN2674_c0_g1~~TRINITY_DN2674_c0_g1_i3.p1  ORF type:complete len:207 (+),score=45.68 TRINITY_DN2674_c0_g1_i3:96-716(+)